MNSSPTTLLEYLKLMQYWLDKDIATYETLFPSTISTGLFDYTAPPGVPKPPHFQPVGRLSIPMAASILSAMDFCGYCIKGNYKDQSRSEKNIKRFYKTIRSIAPQIIPSDPNVSKLVQSCRHGFAHKFFPKHQIAVGYYKGVNDLFIPIPNGSVLNTSALIEHIQIGLKYIIETPSLHPKMENCYNLYIEHIENNVRDISNGQKFLNFLTRIFKF